MPFINYLCLINQERGNVEAMLFPVFNIILLWLDRQKVILLYSLGCRKPAFLAMSSFLSKLENIVLINLIVEANYLMKYEGLNRVLFKLKLVEELIFDIEINIVTPHAFVNFLSCLTNLTLTLRIQELLIARVGIHKETLELVAVILSLDCVQLACVLWAVSVK